MFLVSLFLPWRDTTTKVGFGDQGFLDLSSPRQDVDGWHGRESVAVLRGGVAIASPRSQLLARNSRYGYRSAVSAWHSGTSPSAVSVEGHADQRTPRGSAGHPRLSSGCTYGVYLATRQCRSRRCSARSPSELADARTRASGRRCGDDGPAGPRRAHLLSVAMVRGRRAGRYSASTRSSTALRRLAALVLIVGGGWLHGRNRTRGSPPTAAVALLTGATISLSAGRDPSPMERGWRSASPSRSSQSPPSRVGL